MSQGDLSLKEDTLYWRAHQLVKEGVLERLAPGRYRLISRRQIPFAMEPWAELGQAAEEVHRERPQLKCCVWQTDFLSNFMVQQVTFHFGLIEVERSAVDLVFGLVAESVKSLQGRVFIWNTAIRNSIAHGMAQAAYTSSNYQAKPVYVKAMPSVAPLQRTEGYHVPRIEKVLIDLFCDPILFAAFQGYELEEIIAGVLNRYPVNPTTLRRYGQYRERWEMFKASFGHLFDEKGLVL